MHQTQTLYDTLNIKLGREGDMKKYNTGTTIRTAKSGFLRTYNLSWRQTIRRRRGDAAAVYYGFMYCTHQLMTYYIYTNSRQAARRGQKHLSTVYMYYSLCVATSRRVFLATGKIGHSAGKSKAVVDIARTNHRRFLTQPPYKAHTAPPFLIF